MSCNATAGLSNRFAACRCCMQSGSSTNIEGNLLGGSMKLLQRNFVLFMLLLLVPAGALFAQGTTGTLSGTVVQEGTPLPGVTVSVTSPNLQGTRTTVTNENGGYNFGALPPGDYTVHFELSGLQTATQTVHVGVAQNARADAAMKVTAVSETLTVTGAAPPSPRRRKFRRTFRSVSSTTC